MFSGMLGAPACYLAATCVAVSAPVPPPDASDGVRIPAAPELPGLADLRSAWLFVPARTGELLLAPPREAVWLYERYRLRYWFERIFFTDDMSLGIYPVVGYQTAYGFTAGGRVIARGTIGELVSLQAAYGGQYRQIYRAGLGTGGLLGRRVQLFLGGGYEQRPSVRFFGIGDADLAPLAAAQVPVDALAPGGAFPTRFSLTEVRASAALAVRPSEHTIVQLSTDVTVRWFGRPSSLDPGHAYIADVFDRQSLSGFVTGATRSYTELAAAIDRRSTSRYVGIPTHGWYSGAFVGYGVDLAGPEVSFLRAATEQQLLVNLYDHTRVLALRVYLEGVAGAMRRIPFLELPRLGGVDLLRGYDYDRFRDRLAGLLGVEYRFELNRNIWLALFAEAGRVWRGLSRLDLDGLRLGFGGELRIYSGARFVVRVQVASSTDRELFVRFSFDPTSELFSRTRR